MERQIAILSILFAIIHFVGETFWYFKFGQFLPMLIVDYIAVSLLLYGGIKTLDNPKYVGLLCGAWGFEFCLNYRALFNRMDKLFSGVGHGDPAIDTTAYVLICLMVVSIAMFVLSIYFVNKQVSNE